MLATSGFLACASKSAGNLHAVVAVALAFEPRLACGQFGQPLGDNRKIGAGNSVVKAHKDLSGLHAIAVVHQQLADDAAGRVLHLLHV